MRIRVPNPAFHEIRPTPIISPIVIILLVIGILKSAKMVVILNPNFDRTATATADAATTGGAHTHQDLVEILAQFILTLQIWLVIAMIDGLNENPDPIRMNLRNWGIGILTVGVIVRISASFHGIHEFEEHPRRRREESTLMRDRERESALLLSAVALAELLHLVAALGGGLRRRLVGASTGDVGSYGLPVGGAEVAATEGVPLVSVSSDEGEGLLLGPARGRELPRRRKRRDGGGRWRCRRWIGGGGGRRGRHGIGRRESGKRG
uniref:Uncharacterized protein n=1 Tax=Opuntia streptacantha TaxID=393608 RepID=A0A7C9CMU2_OPUST